MPVSFCVNSYLPYFESESEYTAFEARELAVRELEAILQNELSDADILLRRDSFSLCENGVRVESEIICIENIALTREFETKYN